MRATRQMSVLVLVPLLLGATEGDATNACRPPAPNAQEEQRRHGLAPATLLTARLSAASTDSISAYIKSGVETARDHRLTVAERAAVERALHGLPDEHKYVLRSHLRHLSFIDVPAGAGNGLTAVVGYGDHPIFDITLRAGILNESLSEFLTAKEQAVFVGDGSGTSISVDAPGSALAYVLLHEASHVVDRAIGATGDPRSRLASGIWLDRTRLDPKWATLPVAQNSFRRGSKVPSTSAPALYKSLMATPFPTLYATAAAPEDFAELVTWRELSRGRRQALSVTVRNRSGEVVAVFNPLESPAVQSRFAEVDSLLKACSMHHRTPSGAGEKF